MTQIGKSPLSARRALLAVVVLLSACVRVVHLASLYSTPSFSYHRTWTNSDMYIFDQWAQRIAAGDILGRQQYRPILGWMLEAAPAEKWTQWIGTTPLYVKAPLYAYLIGLLRWLFSDPMLPLVLLQIVASTLSAILLFLIAERLFDTTSGFLAALLFALYAPAIHYDVVMLRGPWIVLVSLLITYQLVRLRSQPTGTASCLLGLAVGLGVLLNEGFLPLPAVVLALLIWWVRDFRQLATLCGAFGLGLAVALCPVAIRNLMVGAPPLQLTPGGNLFFAMCNAGDSDPFFFRHPPRSFVPLLEASGGKLVPLMWLCLKSFRGFGGVLLFYLQRLAALVAPFENPDNFNFYYAALKDPLLCVLPTYAVVFPLGGVGIALAARRLRDIEPFLPVSLTLFTSLMLTLPMSRYRVPLVVLLFPFAGLALAHAGRWVRERRLWAVGAAMAAFCLLFTTAAVLQRYVVFHHREPSEWVYRPAEFQFAAEMYSRENRFREASNELLQLAQVTRSDSVRSDAWVRAAQLQVRAGDTAGARATLQSLSAVSDDDPKALLSVGDAYWHTLNDVPSALDAYRRADALGPMGPVGSAVRQRLSQLEGAPRQ